MNTFFRATACLLALLAFCCTDILLAQRKSSFGGSRSSSSRPSYSAPSRSSGSSFGGSRSSSSRPSYSAPSRSYSSPSASPSRSYSSGSGSGSSFGSRRSTPSYSAPSRSYSSGSSNRSASGSSTAKSYGIPRKESYGGQTYSYRGNTNSVAVNRSTTMIPRNYSYSYNDVYSRRNTYYSGMHFAPPSYIGYTSPSYGMFSTLFMLSALQNLQAQQNAMFFYNHWNTPSMMAWRNDMYTAGQSDPQAAQRIRDLEARVQQLEREKNGQRDTTYMPEGVDSSVVLSNEALGVSDGSDDDRAAREEERRRESEKSSGGGGFFWVVLIGGGLGLWWFVRKRRKARESENMGSFS